MSESIDATGRSGVPDLLGVPEAAALLRVGLTFAYESTARFIATAPNFNGVGTVITATSNSPMSANSVVAV